MAGPATGQMNAQPSPVPLSQPSPVPTQSHSASSPAHCVSLGACLSGCTRKHETHVNDARHLGHCKRHAAPAACLHKSRGQPPHRRAYRPLVAQPGCASKLGCAPHLHGGAKEFCMTDCTRSLIGTLTAPLRPPGCLTPFTVRAPTPEGANSQVPPFPRQADTPRASSLAVWTTPQGHPS